MKGSSKQMGYRRIANQGECYNEITTVLYTRLVPGHIPAPPRSFLQSLLDNGFRGLDVHLDHRNWVLALETGYLIGKQKDSVRDTGPARNSTPVTGWDLWYKL